MAKARVVHSTDAVTVIFEGDTRRPEPTHGIIKFPHGHIEVTRCSDNESYWIHIELDNPHEDSRVDYHQDSNIRE